MTLAAGSRLGHYEIIAQIGAGGMGEVYRAKDSRLGRDVAVKVLPAALAADAEGLARFEREARTVAGLNHPNIVVLYSVEEQGGVRFLTLELVEGQSLDQFVTPGGLPFPRVLDLAIPLADALIAAHGRGVVHRDLKPSNVMVTREGAVKVLDFGLAKLMPASRIDVTQAKTVSMPLSRAGQVLGTMLYMAPEQIRGEQVDARADLFAFGVILFELITGRRPFDGDTLVEVGASILHDPPPSARTLRLDLPPDLSRIVARCLEKDPERRVQTAKDVRNELELVRRAMGSGGGTVADSDAAAQAVPLIAVLPFANRSRNEEDEIFADGITEDVIAQLSRLRTLRVISRRSVMPFKDRETSLQDIASQLRATTILDGSVRRAGDRVRIVAQLVDPATDRTLWAETYDRQLTDIFAIQSDVALQIASALRAELSTHDRERIGRRPTADAKAYELYQRGRHCYLQYTAEGMRRSIEYFEKAIERDPGFALAYVALSVVQTELVEIGMMNRAQTSRQAIASAEAAVRLDPELGEAHCALGYARMGLFDWAGAEAGFQRALELSPGSAEIRDLYGRMCAGLGRFDEAIALHQSAYELDPLFCRTDLATSYLRADRIEEAHQIVAEGVTLAPHDSRVRATLGWVLFKQGRVDEGIADLERAVAMTPGEEIWLAQLGQAYALAGRTEDAQKILRRLEHPARPTPASPYHLAYVYTGLGDAERAIDCLERAFDKGTGLFFGLRGSFLLAPLRSHPRFVALLRNKMNIG